MRALFGVCLFFFGSFALAQEFRVNALGEVVCVSHGLQALSDEVCLKSPRAEAQKFQFGVNKLGQVRCGLVGADGALRGIADQKHCSRQGLSQKFQFGVNLVGEVRCGLVDKSGQLAGVADDELCLKSGVNQNFELRPNRVGDILCALLDDAGTPIGFSSNRNLCAPGRGKARKSPAVR